MANYSIIQSSFGGEQKNVETIALVNSGISDVNYVNAAVSGTTLGNNTKLTEGISLTNTVPVYDLSEVIRDANESQRLRYKGVPSGYDINGTPTYGDGAEYYKELLDDTEHTQNGRVTISKPLDDVSQRYDEAKP